MSKNYDVTVTRDGRWWMVGVPAIDGLTQARRLSEAAEACALADSQSLAQELAAANIPVRDIGALLGLSYQRVSQLVNS